MASSPTNTNLTLYLQCWLYLMEFCKLNQILSDMVTLVGECPKRKFSFNEGVFKSSSINNPYSTTFYNFSYSKPRVYENDSYHILNSLQSYGDLRSSSFSTPSRQSIIGHLHSRHVLSVVSHLDTWMTDSTEHLFPGSRDVCPLCA